MVRHSLLLTAARGGGAGSSPYFFLATLVQILPESGGLLAGELVGRA